MSKQQQALLVTPPLFPKEHSYEMDTFYGFKCSYCQGNGWIPTLEERNECEREDCSVCKGSGRLKAVVTTKWIPDKRGASNSLQFKSKSLMLLDLNNTF